jgi:hypothetical protein
MMDDFLFEEGFFFIFGLSFEKGIELILFAFYIFREFIGEAGQGFPPF